MSFFPSELVGITARYFTSLDDLMALSLSCKRFYHILLESSKQDSRSTILSLFVVKQCTFTIHNSVVTTTIYEHINKLKHGKFEEWQPPKSLLNIIIDRAVERQRALAEDPDDVVHFIVGDTTFCCSPEEVAGFEGLLQTDGTLLVSDHYLLGLREGQSISYYPDGAMKETAEYKHDLKHGLEISYYQHGIIQRSRVFENNILVGHEECFHPNGQKSYAAFWENGQRQGNEEHWADNGVLTWRRRYVNGFQNDHEEGWYTTNNIEFDLQWFHGSRHGTERRYYDNAKHTIQYEREWKEDQKVGVERWYKENGDLLFQKQWS